MSENQNRPSESGGKKKKARAVTLSMVPEALWKKYVSSKPLRRPESRPQQPPPPPT